MLWGLLQISDFKTPVGFPTCLYSALDFKWFSKIFTSAFNFQKVNELSFSSIHVILKKETKIITVKKAKNTVPISMASPPAVKDSHVFGIFFKEHLKN